MPCLVDAGITVWESLAIVEYLAERHAGVWPEAAAARAWARSADGGNARRLQRTAQPLWMSCGLRVRLHALTAALSADLNRFAALWKRWPEAVRWPFLAGSVFGAVDAFFAPVAFRIQTYDLKLDPASMAYVTRLLELRAMRSWYADGLASRGGMRPRGGNRAVWRDLSDLRRAEAPHAAAPAP